MKKGFKMGILLLVLLLFLSLNIVAIFSSASATDGQKRYSAGNWLRDGQGNIVGCSCPVSVGECICEYNIPDK